MRGFRKFIKEKWLIVMFFVAMFCVAFLMYLAAQSGEDYKFKVNRNIEYPAQWRYQFSNGFRGTTSLPANIKLPSEVDSVVLVNTLPKIISQDMVLAYRTNRTVSKVYVDDELRYDQLEYGEKNAKKTWYEAEGNLYNEVSLQPWDTGKAVMIVLEGPNRYVTRPGEVYIGDRSSFLLNIMQSRMYTMIGTLMLIVVAVVILAIWAALTFLSTGVYKETLALFFFTFLVACWHFTESRWAQFMFGNMRIFSILGYNSLILICAPISIYFYYSKHDKVRFHSKIATGISLFTWLFINICQICNIADYGQTLLLVQIVCGIELFYLAYIQIKDIRLSAKENQDGRLTGQFWKIPLVGLVFMVPMILIELIIYAVPSFRSDNTVFLTIAIMIYILALALQSALKVTEEKFEATAANETKTQFLANMSHEIRTPLNAILGFDEIIIRDSDDENIKEYARHIKLAGDSLKEIINSILDMSKIESGKMEIEEAGYSIQQLLDATCDIVGPMAANKGLEFKTKIDESLPVFMVGDNVRIRQILVNLLNNAVKYTKRGSVTLSVSLVEMNKEKGVCSVKFSVADTGQGIKDEDREKLFARFERVDYQKNKNVEGTGLGMSIVTALLEAMNSKIELDSVYGEGSDFYFTIEQKVIGDTVLGKYEPGASTASEFGQEEVEAFVAPNAKVLIVDDVELNIQVTRGLLGNLSMQIDDAYSGMEVIEKIRNTRYDIVFMDHMMPEMDGVEATAAIRALAEELSDSYYSTVPIIALTANALTGMREQFLDAGFQDYVAKPVEGKALIACIKKWLPSEMIQDAAQNEEAVQEDSRWQLELQGINPAEARKYVSTFDAYIDTMRTYELSYEDNIQKLEGYAASQDYANNAIVVHALKSSSKIIGAMELSEEARLLEELSKAADPVLWENQPVFLDHYKDIVLAIREYEQQHCQENAVILEPEELMQCLSELAEAAENFDIDGLMQWEKKYGMAIVSDEYQREYGEKWIGLKKMVSNVSFSEILEVMDIIKEDPFFKERL